MKNLALKLSNLSVPVMLSIESANFAIFHQLKSGQLKEQTTFKMVPKEEKSKLISI